MWEDFSLFIKCRFFLLCSVVHTHTKHHCCCYFFSSSHKLCWWDFTIFHNCFVSFTFDGRMRIRFSMKNGSEKSDIISFESPCTAFKLNGIVHTLVRHCYTYTLATNTFNVHTVPLHKKLFVFLFFFACFLDVGVWNCNGTLNHLCEDHPATTNTYNSMDIVHWNWLCACDQHTVCASLAKMKRNEWTKEKKTTKDLFSCKSYEPQDGRAFRLLFALFFFLYSLCIRYLFIYLDIYILCSSFEVYDRLTFSVSKFCSESQVRKTWEKEGKKEWINHLNIFFWKIYF